MSAHLVIHYIFLHILLPPLQWYMLTVVYVHKRLKNSEVMCYVDGILSSTGEVVLPATDDVSLLM